MLNIGRNVLLLLALLPIISFASSTRIVPADSFVSSDASKSYVMPNNVVDGFTCNSSTTAWTLSHAPSSTTLAMVHIDGMLQTNTTDYSISSTTLTVSPACATGQKILVLYSY